jgi:hypothetical protein
MSKKVVGLQFQNLLTMLGSRVNIIGGRTYVTIMPRCQWTLIIHDYLRLVTNSYVIDLGFFKHICKHT